MTKPRNTPPKLAHARCTGTTKAGEPCKLAAGFGTSHPGFGRCRYHGGGSIGGKREAAGLAARYAVAVEDLIDDPDLHTLIGRVKQRGDVTDLTEDLALARALVIHYVNRAEALEQALLRWSSSWHPDWQQATSILIEELQVAHGDEDWERYASLLAQVPDPLRFMDRPRKITDMVMAVQRLKDVANIAQAIYQQQEAGSIPARDVEVLMVEIASAVERSVRKHVRDVTTRAAVLAAIEVEWGTLRLPSWEEAERGDPDAVERVARRGLDA